jgi:hypothetical protein
LGRRLDCHHESLQERRAQAGRVEVELLENLAALEAIRPFKKMRFAGEPSTAAIYPFWPGYVINMCGYEFSERTVVVAPF